MRNAFALVTLIVAPTLAFAQGTVVFQNLTGQVKQWTSATDPTLVAVSSLVELIAAPSGTPLTHPLGTLDAQGFHLAYPTEEAFLAANPVWTAWGVAVAGSRAPGYFNSGTASLASIPGGASADYIIVGWLSTAPHLDAAIAGGAFIGESAVFTTTTGDPSTIPPGLAVSLKSTFTGMTLAPQVVPEPSIFKLAGLGAVVLMLFRRRS